MGTAVGLSPVWQQAQFFDNNGYPLANGQIWTYASYQDETYTSWTDKTGTVENTNPIILDASGRIQTEIWLRTGDFYGLVLCGPGEPNGEGGYYPGPELARVRDVSVLRIIAGTNVTIDPPDGTGPNLIINAAGSVGNPKGRGQTYIFSGANQSGQYLVSNGSNLSLFNFTNETVVIGSPDVAWDNESLTFSFATAGTYSISITTTITPISSQAWPLGQNTFGAIFGANTSYHTRYSADPYDGLGTSYQHTSFTDMFNISTGGGSVALQAYFRNGNGVSEQFNTSFMILITRIGDQLG